MCRSAQRMRAQPIFQAAHHRNDWWPGLGTVGRREWILIVAGGMTAHICKKIKRGERTIEIVHDGPAAPRYLAINGEIEHWFEPKDEACANSPIFGNLVLRTSAAIQRQSPNGRDCRRRGACMVTAATGFSSSMSAARTSWAETHALRICRAAWAEPWAEYAGRGPAPR